MNFKENIFRHNNVSIKYFEKGSGEPILFLQGGGVRALTYEKILSELSKKYRVIAPDIPCFGSGTVPKEIWGLQDYGDFFVEFIKFLNLKDFTLAGHSFGGGIALSLATKSEGIKNLILIDSAGKFSGYSEIKFRYKFYIQKTFFDITHYRNISTFFLILKDFLVNRIKKFFEWPHIVRIIKKCLLNNFVEFQNIKVPTLILWGKRDEIFPPNLAKIINQEISGSVLRFTNGNHDWCLFRHNELLELVDQWLEKKKIATDTEIR